MKHTLIKWLSTMLIACMLITAGPAALMEEVMATQEDSNSDEIVSESVEEPEEEIVLELGDTTLDNGDEKENFELSDDPVEESYDAIIDDVTEKEPIAKSFPAILDSWYENFDYIVKLPFQFTTAPYESADKAGWAVTGNTITITKMVENGYHSMWGITSDGKYVFMGRKKENGIWKDSGTGYLGSITKDNSYFHVSDHTNTYYYGKQCDCKIVLHSNVTMDKVEVALVKNVENTATGFKYIPLTPKYSIDQNYINDNGLTCWAYDETMGVTLPFESLPAGDTNGIVFFITRRVKGEKFTTQLLYHFSVVISTSSQDYDAPNYTSSISFNNIAYPTNYKISTSGYALGAGTVNSTYPLTSLKSEIVRDNGQVISSYTRSISGTSYAVKNLDTYSSSDNGVHFSWIKEPGTYYWKLTATDNKGHSETHSMKFTAYKDNPPPADTTKPSISNVKVTNVTSDGYTVSCTVSDNVGVTRVAFPTWTDPSGQDDLKWMDGSISGSTATFNVRVSDHGNQRGCTYITHVYAYDAAGNSNSVSAGNISVPAATVLPTGVSLNTGSLSLTVGQTSTLTPTITPSNASNMSVSWKSSDGSVASVNSNGLVSALKAGTATITVTTSNGKTASCIVNVQGGAQVNPTGISLNVSSGTLAVGQTGQLIATVSPANATNKTVTWTSSKTSVAKVDANGIVTAVKKGSAKITAMTSNGKKVTCSIKVVEAPKPKSVALNQKGTVELSLDSTLQLQAAVSPAGVSTTLKWSSSSTKIATVTSDGLVKPVKEGTAKITVKTANGKKATVKIKVFDPYAPQSIAFPVKKGKMKVGTTYTLEYTLKPSTARTTVTLKSSNTKVVSIEGTNTLHALKKGSATITATTSNGKKATVKVTVEK